MLSRLRNLLELNWWGSPDAPWYGSLGVSVVFHFGMIALFAALWVDRNRADSSVPVAAEWSNRTDTPLPDIDFERPSESGPRRCLSRQPPAARKLVRKSNSPIRVRRSQSDRRDDNSDAVHHCPTWHPPIRCKTSVTCSEARARKATAAKGKGRERRKETARGADSSASKPPGKAWCSSSIRRRA